MDIQARPFSSDPSVLDDLRLLDYYSTQQEFCNIRNCLMKITVHEGGEMFSERERERERERETERERERDLISNYHVCPIHSLHKRC